MSLMKCLRNNLEKTGKSRLWVRDIHFISSIHITPLHKIHAYGVPTYMYLSKYTLWRLVYICKNNALDNVLNEHRVFTVTPGKYP